jgi:fructose-1,6-bisphosphatase/inositol monophosphatase family enzyme
MALLLTWKARVINRMLRHTRRRRAHPTWPPRFRKEDYGEDIRQHRIRLCRVTTGTLDAVTDSVGHLNSHEIAAAQFVLLESGRVETTADDSS